MTVLLKYTTLALLAGVALGQYGPLPSNTRHRTTTTTEVPDSANEVLPPSPYQPPPGYKPPEENPHQGSTYAQPTYQPSPTPQNGPSNQPFPQGHPSTQGQPGQPSPTPQGPYGQPTPQGQPGPQGQPSPTPQGQPGPYGQSTPQGQPGHQGRPSPTPQGQPGPYGQPTPQGQPGHQGQPSPTPQGQPGPYGQPTPQGQPGHQGQPSPTPQGQPGPYGQFTPQGQPGPVGQPSPTPQGQPGPYGQPTPQGQPAPQGQPGPYGQPSPSPQPTPGSQPQYPSPGPQGPVGPQGQPGPQGFPSTPYQPTPIQGQPTGQIPQTVVDYQQFRPPRPPPSTSPQFWWANPQTNPFRPGAQPQALAPPASPTYQPAGSGCTSSPPSQPQLGPPNRPGFPPQPQQPVKAVPQPSRPSYPPQPQQPVPQPSRPSYPPQPSLPNQQQPIQSSISPPTQNYSPGQQLIPIPENPKPNPINPNNPFLQSSLQNPIRQETTGPICYAEAAFCVPSSQCYNGIIADSIGNPTKKGPCSAGEVCCKTKKPITTLPGYPNQPLAKPQYVTEGPVQKYTGPLNTTPSPECAAALKCVDIAYCTAEGVMSNTPVVLTREQSENRVPLTDCQDVNTGRIGKCCRDPNYKDPWPAGMMMPKTDGGFDDGLYHPPNEQKFDDGQYHPTPEGQYTTETTNPHTIKIPLGVYNQKVTPFPIAPRPGQTHSQVFPGNEDQQFPRPTPLTPHHTAGQPLPPQAGYSPQQPTYQTQQPTYQPPQPGYQPQPQQPYQPQPQQPTYQPQQPQFPTQQPTYQPQQPQFPTQQPTYQPQQPQSQPNPPQPQPQNPPQPSVYPSQQPTSQAQPSPTPQQPTFQPQSPSPYQPQPNPYSPQAPGSSPPPYQTTSPVQPYSGQPQPIPGQECGVRRETPGTKPDEAGFGEFPWHALILSKSNNSALCSAVIIAPNAVVTAAHCIEGLKPEEMQIKAGGYTLGQDGPKPSQTRPVGAAAIHPNYNSGSLVRDEAVIVTEEPLVFDSHIDKVCLAPSGPQDYQPSGRTCYVTGYGRPALQRNTVGTPLHKVPVELIPKDQCENKLKATHLGKYFILNEGFTCAVPPKESELCKVDVGSPLVCEKSDGKYELAGVYSWDTKCSTELPGVTAACDTQWIQRVLATPIQQLREEYIQRFTPIHTALIIDVDSKPGFALGYGK